MSVTFQDGHFTTPDDLKLYERRWLPEGESQGAVVIVHGLAEHSGRYTHVGEFFAEHGFTALAFDHRGHGQSAGGHDTFVKKYQDWIEDLNVFMRKVHAINGEKPLFLLGHSLGGLIVTTYVLMKRPHLTGVLLSGAALKIGSDISPLLLKVAGLLSKISPHTATIKLNNDSVSRDPAVAKHYDEDPLNYRGGIPARTGAEMNKAIQFCEEHFTEFSLPVRIMFGTGDKLVDPAGSYALYEKASSKDKTIKAYDGLYHEIMNEPEKEMVLNEMLEWMKARC